MSIRWALPGVVIATLAAAGLTACGGAEESSGTHAAAHAARTAQPAARTGPANLTVRRSRLGPMLVDASGRSLYLFTQDKPGRPACTSDYLRCTEIWTPVVTRGRPHGEGGVRSGLLGVVHRTKPAGSQVTYNGHPLYRTVDDKQAGDLNGQAMYDYWYVVSPSGRAIGRK